MLTLVVAVLAGVVIGLSLGLLGAGGSILAVPVLVYLLGESPAQATTGSLLVVGVTAALAAGLARARDASTVHVARGLAFGAVASGGAVLGATWAAGADEDWLLAGFGLLMLVVTAATVLNHRRRDPEMGVLDTPVITFRPTFACACPRAAKVLLTATVVGLLTGLLGVGGGFLVVPALTLALGMPLREAAGTSLVAITVTSATALLTRLGHGLAPDLLPVGLLTAAAVVGALTGVRLSGRIRTRRLAQVFVAVLALLGTGVSAVALPAVL